jgi:hypothetical protein
VKLLGQPNLVTSLEGRQKMRCGFAFLSFTMAFVVAGCGGGEDRVETVPVTGTLQIDGKPFGPAQVDLRSEDGSLPSATGKASADGTFSLSTYEPDDGAAIGAYRVTILMDPMSEPFRAVPPMKAATASVGTPAEGQPFVLELNLESAKARPGQMPPAGGDQAGPVSPSAGGI